jgi:hypothetical protein
MNIHRVNAAGKEQIIHIFRAGESFAEAGLATPTGYPADARALEPDFRSRPERSCDASSPVAAAIIPLPGKMRRGRRYHPVATRRRRYFRLAASGFGLNPRKFCWCKRRGFWSCSSASRNSGCGCSVR